MHATMSARASEPMGVYNAASRTALSVLACILIVGPLAAIVTFAVGGDPSALLSDPRFLPAVRSTIIVTASATVTATVLAVPLAWAVGRARLRHVWLWDNLSLLPAVVPPLVGAVGWLVLLSPRVGILNTWLKAAGIPPITVLFTPVGIGMVIGLYQAPFMFTHVRGALQQVSASYEQAARVFGASPAGAFFGIALALVRPSLLSATLAVVMRSAANIGVPLILGQTARIHVLANLLFSYVFSEGNLHRAAQLGLLFVAVAAVLYYLQHLLLRNRVVSTIQVRQARSDTAVVTAGTRRAARAILAGYALLSLVLPLLGVGYLSLTPFWNPNVLSARYSLRNYEQVLANGIAQGSVLTTLCAAFAGAFLVVLLATVVCYNATRGRSRWDRVNSMLFAIPLGVPPVVFGVGVLLTILRLPLPVYGTIAAAIWAYTAYWAAFGSQAIDPYFRQIPKAYDEASAIAGDAAGRRLTNILLPMLASNLVLVGGLLLLNMMTDLPLVIFLTAPSSTIMAAQLYAFWSQAVPVQAAAFAIEMIAVALIATAAIMLLRQLLFHRRPSPRP